MPNTDNKNREPSMFSWLSAYRSPYERQIQMNPVSAIIQTQAVSTVKRLISGVGVLVIILAIIAGTAYYMQGASTINASFNFSQSITGSVLSVDQFHNSFTLLYSTSPDSRVSSLGKAQWTVIMPPGTSFSYSRTGRSICFLVPDLNGNLSDEVMTTCSRVVLPGKKLLIEYLFLTPDKNRFVAKTIIGENK